MECSPTSSYISLLLQFPLGPSLDYMIKKISMTKHLLFFFFLPFFSIPPTYVFSVANALNTARIIS